MKSICFVSNNIYPLLTQKSKLNFIGGAELQQLLIGKELIHRGYEVTYITSDHGHGMKTKIGSFNVLATYKPSEGLPILRFFYPRLVKIWQALNRSDADIYYVRCAGFLLAVVVWWARLNNKKTIYCGAYDPDFAPKELQLKHYRDRLMYFWGLKNCDAVIVQNSYQKVMLMKNFKRSGIIIHNGAEQLDEIPKDKNTILWVANIKEAKAPEVFINLAKQIPDYKFVMIGGRVKGQEDLYEYITKEAQNLSNFEFKEFLPLQETEKEFDRARLFINTSIYEGFPNTFLQAWRQGIPVLSFVNPDELITKHSLGRIADNKEDMANKLHLILKHKDEMGSESIRKYFNENLVIEKQVDKYEKLFDSIMKNIV